MKTKSQIEDSLYLHQILVCKNDNERECHEILSGTTIDVSKYISIGYKVTNLSYSCAGAGNDYGKEFVGRYTFILEKYIVK